MSEFFSHEPAPAPSAASCCGKASCWCFIQCPVCHLPLLPAGMCSGAGPESAVPGGKIFLHPNPCGRVFEAWLESVGMPENPTSARFYEILEASDGQPNEAKNAN